MYKRKDEVSHDEDDIDMLSSAKKSCEKYLISTQRPQTHQSVCVMNRWNFLTEGDLVDKSTWVNLSQLKMHAYIDWDV